MKTTIMVMVACSLVAGAALAAEHPKGEHPKGEHPAAKPGAGVLDGKTFAGEIVKSGEAKGDKDTLTFKDGKFVSSACVAYGFHETSYTASAKDGVTTFTASAANDKGETMAWSGTIKQGVVEATAVNKAPSGETTYSFRGKMVAVAPSAKSDEHPKNSEHPKK